MPPTPPELCCRVGMALILIGSHDPHAATQFGKREGNRFPSLLRLVSPLNLFSRIEVIVLGAVFAGGFAELL